VTELIVVPASPFPTKDAFSIGDSTGNKRPGFDGARTVAKTYNRPGVYSGGWVAAFCLDAMIQKQTGGRKGIDDLFRLMESRFGLTGNEYTPEDVQRAASEIAGTDLTRFFARYIASSESLPVKECLSDAGFEASIVDYGGEVYISRALSPSASALAIQRRLFNGTP